MGHRLVFRTWTYGMKQEALRRATRWERDPSGGLAPDVDPWILNDVMLVQTLVDWDLKGEDGQPLPISIEAIHAIEPPELVEAMIRYTQRINGVSVEERKNSGGGEAREGRAATRRRRPLRPDGVDARRAAAAAGEVRREARDLP
jgi:hypothetical protein